MPLKIMQFVGNRAAASHNQANNTHLEAIQLRQRRHCLGHEGGGVADVQPHQAHQPPQLRQACIAEALRHVRVAGERQPLQLRLRPLVAAQLQQLPVAQGA